MDRLPETVVPVSPPAAGPTTNPLLSLLAALVRAALYLLSVFRQLVGFCTITLPLVVVNVLSWSWTFQLNFPVVFFLLCLIPLGIFLLVRYKYLNKYEELKEPPLKEHDPKPLHPDVLSSSYSQEKGPMHNYLDEFLSAIRVFGFLEKPVFHELSRHLQTRRLVAGDSLSLDPEDKSFYCVVDGHVQVFAPSPPGLHAPHAHGQKVPSTSTFKRSGGGPAEESDSEDDDEAPLNGFDLLTEVSSGGTLSSLFTILSLFTEDVRLEWDSPTGEESEAEAYKSSLEVDFDGLQEPHQQQQQQQDLSSFRDALNLPARSEKEVTTPVLPSSPFGPGDRTSSSRSSTSQRAFGRTPLDSPRTAQPGLGSRSSSARQTRGGGTPMGSTREFGKGARFTGGREGRDEERGTVARATVDSTLAVIPAEAFRRLTRKFPKASAHIVQVILTRFSRVTFSTAHTYLGLTSEVLRAESSLNSLVSHPLPAQFYEGGGMQALRDKFRQEKKSSRGAVDGQLVEEIMDDFEPKGRASYFSTVPGLHERQKSGLGNQSSTNIDGLNLATEPLNSSPTSIAATLPSAAQSPSVSTQLSHSRTPLKTPGPPRGPSSPPMMRRPSGAPFLRRGNTRKNVQAGDLLSMTDSAESSYRPQHFAPATPRPLTWDHPNQQRQPQHASVENALPDFNLRDAVMESLAKSIGLIQPPPLLPDSASTYAPSLGGSSIVHSPSSYTPFAQSSSSYASFGAGLSMLERLGDEDSVMTGGSGGWAAGSGTGEAMEELENEVEILFFPKGGMLVKEGEKNAGLFFVIDGALEVSLPAPKEAEKPKDKKPKSTIPSASEGASHSSGSVSRRQLSSSRDGHAPPSPRSSSPRPTQLYTVKPGGVAGYLSALSNAPSYVDLKAKTDVYVGFLPADALERLLERRPIVLLTLAKRLISLLSPLVLHIDASLEWVQLDAGQVLYRQGDVSDSIYIVVNGRLRALQDNEESSQVDTVAEHGQGESVGELDAITKRTRSSTVHAVRDTELARMPLTLFNAISVRHPATTIKLLQIIASRVTKEVDIASHRPQAITPGALELVPSNLNLKTVAILPSSRNVPVAAFAKRLRMALEDIGAPTAYLDQATVTRHLGRHTFSTMGKLKVAGWLAELEQRYKMVLYVADAAVTSQWTLTCLRQADHIMILGMGDDPSIGEFEKVLLAKHDLTARKDLVLLHPDRSVASGSTRPWLKERPWISQHHHVELPGLVLPTKAAPLPSDPKAVAAVKRIRDQVQTQIKRLRRHRPIGRVRTSPHMNDFARLARRLCGASIGVVLGGGGGRGIAHLGFLETLEDEGVPVDMIGGTSIGSFVGGLYAKDSNLLAAHGLTKQFSGRMGSMWRILSDVTFPTIAYTTGHEFNRGIFKAFNDVHLEDLWIPFFCNSTDLNYSKMQIHTTGYAWRAVRASMTLAGLLPPLSENGSMLVDGGYIDNLPVSTMTQRGASRIFAIDVGGIDDPSPRNYGDTVSGFYVLINRYNPWSNARNIPTLTEVTGRLTYVSSVKSLAEAKAAPGVLYLEMPVQHFDTLGGFSKFDEILAIGREAARKQLGEWRVEGRLPTGLLRGSNDKSGRAKDSVRMRRNSI